MSTKEKDTKEEELQTLPVGHPQAGYVTPDLSETDHVGKMPDEEQEWVDTRDDAHDEQVEAIAKREDEVAKDEKNELEKLAEESRQNQTDDTPAAKSSKTSSASSSSGSAS